MHHVSLSRFRRETTPSGAIWGLTPFRVSYSLYRKPLGSGLFQRWVGVSGLGDFDGYSYMLQDARTWRVVTCRLYKPTVVFER